MCAYLYLNIVCWLVHWNSRILLYSHPIFHLSKSMVKKKYTKSCLGQQKYLFDDGIYRLIDAVTQQGKNGQARFPIHN